MGGPTAKGERQPGERPAESRRKVPRAGHTGSRRAQDAARPGVLPRGEGKRVVDGREPAAVFPCRREQSTVIRTSSPPEHRCSSPTAQSQP